MMRYILRLVFHWVGGNEFKNYESMIRTCLINTRLALNKLVISFNVEIYIISMDIKTLEISLDYDDFGALLASFVVRPTLVDQIRGKQM